MSKELLMLLWKNNNKTVQSILCGECSGHKHIYTSLEFSLFLSLGCSHAYGTAIVWQFDDISWIPSTNHSCHEITVLCGTWIDGWMDYGQKSQVDFFSNGGASSLQKRKAKQSSGRNMTIKSLEGAWVARLSAGFGSLLLVDVDKPIYFGRMLYCAQNRGREVSGCCCYSLGYHRFFPKSAGAPQTPEAHRSLWDSYINWSDSQDRQKDFLMCVLQFSMATQREGSALHLVSASVSWREGFVSCGLHMPLRILITWAQSLKCKALRSGVSTGTDAQLPWFSDMLLKSMALRISRLSVFLSNWVAFILLYMGVSAYLSKLKP